jgi:FkbM family methyltransferase
MLTTRQKIALARFAKTAIGGIRRTTGRGDMAEVTRRSIRWRLDLREGIDFSIYLLGAFELTTIEAYGKLLQPDDLVLDIGANIGAHTLHLARAVGPRGRVLAFEPTDYAFGKLRANLSLNPQLIGRVEAHQLMLLDRSEAPPPALYSSWPLSPASGDVHEGHLGRLQSTAGAQGMTLDEFVENHGLTRLDLIKLDVDGFECRVLRGAENTLKRFKPAMIMELSPYVLEEQGDSLHGLVMLLASHDYRLYSISSGKELPLDPASLEKLVPAGASCNVVVR